MKVSFYRYMLAAFAAASLTAAGSALAQVDVAKSSVTATSKQMNVPVEGKFGKFTAQLKFDPAKPADGSAQLSIDVASYDLGDESYNDQVRGKDWFDAKTYPSATFVSSAIAPAGGNQFKVTGKLTIKGKSQTVVVPVTVTPAGRRANLRRFAADQALAIRHRHRRMERHVGGRRRCRHQVSYRCSA